MEKTSANWRTTRGCTPLRSDATTGFEQSAHGPLEGPEYKVNSTYKKHSRIAEAEHQRILLAAHRPPRGEGVARLQPHPEEKTILTTVPEIADYVAA